MSKTSSILNFCVFSGEIGKNWESPLCTTFNKFTSGRDDKKTEIAFQSGTCPYMFKIVCISEIRKSNCDWMVFWFDKDGSSTPPWTCAGTHKFK